MTPPAATDEISRLDNRAYEPADKGAVDDYEAFAARSQRRFRNRVLAALGALLAALYVPWASRRPWSASLRCCRGWS